MISVSNLYCGVDTNPEGTSLRYNAGGAPVVVFNCTARCNLACEHCYADATKGQAVGELTTTEAKKLISTLGRMKTPVILFSGGEPLLREDVVELIAWAAQQNIRPVLSTNGTLLTASLAKNLQAAGVVYVGISIDGREAAHDRFRRAPGSFAAAVAGVKNCQAAGVKSGLRFTLTSRTQEDLPYALALAEELEVARLCFYHLVLSGRGRNILDSMPSSEQARRSLEQILAATRALHERGKGPEVLTVDNHADGIFIYLKLVAEGNARAEAVRSLLTKSGGNKSGQQICCIGATGDVYPDQFMRTHIAGNIRRAAFDTIWNEPTGILAELRARRTKIKGRCARCAWFEQCGGNFRARAEYLTGDLWAEDPACYLSEEEIT